VQQKREKQAFEKNVERSKMIRSMEEKREAKQKQPGSTVDGGTADTKVRRHFGQKPVLRAEQRSLSNTALRKVFD
jgi:hypothetical protein